MSKLTFELDPQPTQAISSRVRSPSILTAAAAQLRPTTRAGLRMMLPFSGHVESIAGQDVGLILVANRDTIADLNIVVEQLEIGLDLLQPECAPLAAS
ncbi:MAG: hypothetical protein P8O03_08800 [Ilumatobacter sp.]|nr:hypothetical protein [bacterium]MDG1266408.1 hypothetical protein [Ilumatobacter sp.]NKB39735.1 hypothetical protein [Ilumatobacter sp.]